MAKRNRYELHIDTSLGEARADFAYLPELEIAFSRAVIAIAAQRDPLEELGIGSLRSADGLAKPLAVRAIVGSNERRLARITQQAGQLPDLQMKPFSGEDDLLLPAGSVYYRVVAHLADGRKLAEEAWRQDVAEICALRFGLGQEARANGSAVTKLEIERVVNVELLRQTAHQARHPWLARVQDKVRDVSRAARGHGDGLQ